MIAPGQPLHDAAGAACRNAAAAIDELYVSVEKAARAAGLTPAVNEAIYHMDKACRLLDAAADIYYKGPDIEIIETMRRVRERAAADAAERETRRKKK